MKHLIDDNGVVREMTAEEISAWEAECAEFEQNNGEDDA